MINSIITKLAMLVMFLLAVTAGWAAITMVFPISLYNILLAILAAFFLLRAFELADKVNKLGPYAEEEEDDRKRPGPRFGEAPPSDEDAPSDEE